MAYVIWGRLRTIYSVAFRQMSSSVSAVEKSTVLVEDRGSVRLIGINRPQARNAVNPATAKLLYNAFKDFDKESGARVAVLHGVGGTFCAGFDLKELANIEDDAALKQNIADGLPPLGPSHLTLSKPVLAAVNGYAVAGGLELALLCDLRVMEEDAVMGVFCRRFGVPLIDGGTVRLPALIGLSRAMDLILTGRPVVAEEALSIGLANRVVPKGEALDAAIKLAEHISNFPQQCLQTDRLSAIRSSLGNTESIAKALKEEYSQGIQVVLKESVPGARRFSKGAGRHGKL